MTDKTFEKYKAVIDEWFVNGFNGTKAYQKVYPKSKVKSAEANFRKILAITRIEDYVEKKREAISEANKITIDECVSLLTSMARFDIADCYGENGELLPIHEIPKETRLAIEALDIEERNGIELNEGGISTATIKKLKTSNRRANVVELLKVLGGYEKDNHQKNQDNIVIFRIPDNGRG